MIITKQWLNECINIENISTDDIAKELNSIGLEVDGVDKIRMPKDVVIGSIISCEKHPNADKLNVCKVDLGDKIEQIVCGAKNVASGQMVPVARVGSILPGNFKIKEAKLRDIDSNGMICSSTELGFPKINDGIMVLDESIGELEVGKQLSELPLLNDDIIELELTANRGDCLSIHGVARDISVPFNLDVKPVEIKEEDEHQLGVGRVLNVSSGDKIESSFIFKAVDSKEIKSNLLIDLRLALVGESFDDDLDKLLAYATYFTGVLFRAYDEKAFCTKDDKTLLSARKQANGLNAVLGKKRVSFVGLSQEVESKATKDSKRIILEANYTHPTVILENKLHKQISTDRHLYRSSRGSESDLDFGINYLSNLLLKSGDVMIYAGSQQVVQDYENVIINIHIKELTDMIGQFVEKNRLINILQGLGFEVIFKHEQESMNIKVPAFRHDVLNKQDICEEIVRMIGIDNIESKPLIFAQSAKHNDSYVNFKKRQAYRFKSASNGFFESLHFIFDDRARNDKYELDNVYKNRDIANPITSELNTLRSSLLPNMLDSISKNKNYGKNSIALFEIGTVFNKNREENINIAFVFSGDKDFANISNNGKPQKIDFYSFARAISNIIGKFELEVKLAKTKLSDPYESALIKQNDEILGTISRLHTNVQNDYGIDKTYICELDFSKLSWDKTIVKSYSSFQAISRDLSLLIPKEMTFSKIRDFLNTQNIANLINFNAIDLYKGEELGDKFSLSIKFHFQSNEKTLKDEDVAEAMDKILALLKKELDITIR
ncbi:MAG: phenylalanine--tRNA ligase subunit beta [Epsilonproteobacteria bacterium]|nr:phenylalanine--tRNA ligase subunit beta [Campylobacterota bacterium]